MSEIKLDVYVKKQRVLPVITEHALIVQKHWTR